MLKIYIQNMTLKFIFLFNMNSPVFPSLDNIYSRKKSKTQGMKKTKLVYKRYLSFLASYCVTP